MATCEWNAGADRRNRESAAMEERIPGRCAESSSEAEYLKHANIFYKLRAMKDIVQCLKIIVQSFGADTGGRKGGGWILRRYTQDPGRRHEDNSFVLITKTCMSQQNEFIT